MLIDSILEISLPLILFILVTLGLFTILILGMFADTVIELFLGLILIALTTLGIHLYCKKQDKENGDVKDIEEDHIKEDDSSKQTIASKKKKKLPERKTIKEKLSDPDLIGTLKGHGGTVTDLDMNTSGKYLISCASDRSILIWSTKTFAQKEHKSVRYNIEFDAARCVRWSPDSKAFLVSQVGQDTVQVFRVGRRDDGFPGNFESLLTFPSKQHESDVIAIGIACHGRFIMSCDRATSLIVWNLKGEVLHKLNTLQGNNYFGAVSPCGRFVASCGFTPDVKVWEVNFSKSQEFQDVSRAFVLAGHKSSVYRFAFNNDSSRMASISKDGTWKLWDTNVEYRKGQEPRLLLSGPLDAGLDPWSSQLALSPDGRTLVFNEGPNLVWVSGVTGERVHSLDHPFPGELPTAVLFAASGTWLLVAGGKAIHVFSNTWGYRNTIAGLEVARKSATSHAVASQLDARISEAKSILQSLSSQEN